MKSRRSIATAMALGLSCLSLAACGSGGGQESTEVGESWSEIEELASTEGEVTIYSSQVPDSLNNLEQAFEAAYPEIDLVVIRDTDAALAPKVEAEAQTNQQVADVYVSASEPWILANQELMVDVAGPAYEDPAYDTEMFSPRGTDFAIGAATPALGWNTDLLPGGLTDYEDLLDSDLAGKFGIMDGTVSASLSDFYGYLDELYGDDFLEELADQGPRFYPSSVPMGEALSSGEITASNFVSIPQIEAAKANGAPVDWALIDEPWGTPYQALIVKGSPHQNAAQVLANFMLTPEGQVAIAKNVASVLPDTEGAVAFAGDLRQPDPDRIGADAVADFNDTWQKIFGG